MFDHEFVESEFIDWGQLLENIPDNPNFDLFSNSPDSGASLSVDDIEQYLMNDDSHPEEKYEDNLVDEFLSDVLLDSSPGSGSDRSKDSSTSPDSVEVGTDHEEKEGDKSDQSGADVPQTKENDVVDVVDDDDDENDDPSERKRKRQIRNRDAAVRSRERKKMYVKDLEIKSKYYEAECRRLGNFLQCCLAENQALRLSLHTNKAFDASMSKQESAVLLLESLLLGSLLGFLGIIYLLTLPSQLLSILEKALLPNVGSAEWENVTPPRKEASNVFVFRVQFHSFMMTKRCKASRSRMKLSPVVL
ncbi:hypothetical protein MIMGU_mgv1a018866mg [Erythranthe guttata]|uniref:BZIP domain-containing protein n=1 Tax=Erythranthe guttata TaxID=4155 RepID=A0A022QVG3_ERYGU|nr:PREDICTED: bZIP transcription factor 60-like [Erythranthe guttata]EYU30475.1 hypothetical protein MIMGU_mgv1a018866mg [Erythranthe guttata]|eukprot:XP_012845689.1 PREDICTED: bZIP transcription factor 60-like [Erythranthe guttata]